MRPLIWLVALLAYRAGQRRGEAVGEIRGVGYATSAILRGLR